MGKTYPALNSQRHVTACIPEHFHSILVPQILQVFAIDLAKKEKENQMLKGKNQIFNDAG